VSVSSLYVPYKKDFEPLVRSGEYIAIPTGRTTVQYFKVLYVEPVAPITITSIVDANAIDTEVSMDAIKLPDNYAGQWRIAVEDLVEAKMYYPRAVPKYNTKEEVSYIPINGNGGEPNFKEFYTWKDEVPTLLVSNPLDEEQLARFKVWGFKYSIIQVEQKPPEYTFFPVYSAEYIIGSTGV